MNKFKPEDLADVVWTCGNCFQENSYKSVLCSKCNAERVRAKQWGRPWVLQLPYELSLKGWQIRWLVTLNQVVEPGQPLFDLIDPAGTVITKHSPGLFQVVQLVSTVELDNGEMATFRLLSPVDDTSELERNLFEGAEILNSEESEPAGQPFPDFLDDAPIESAAEDSKKRFGGYRKLIALAIVILASSATTYYYWPKEASGPTEDLFDEIVEPLSEQEIVNEVERIVRALRLSRDVARRRSINQQNILEFANRDLDNLLEPTRRKVEEQNSQLEEDRNDFLLAAHWLRDAANGSPTNYASGWDKINASVQGTPEERVFSELKDLIDRQIQNPGPRNEIITLTWWNAWINKIN